MTGQNRGKDKYNFVLYIPEIMHQNFRVTDAGRVILDFKINPVKKLLGRLVNREPAADVELDELSSSVWLNMDGTRSILYRAHVTILLSFINLIKMHERD